MVAYSFPVAARTADNIYSIWKSEHTNMGATSTFYYKPTQEPSALSLTQDHFLGSLILHAKTFSRIRNCAGATDAGEAALEPGSHVAGLRGPGL